MSPRGRARSLSAPQRRILLAMASVVVALHLAGFALLLVLVGAHGRGQAIGTFTIGIGLTAYALGLRHAFDADHIAAIDNTTRKLVGDGDRPLSVGFWFSLGHATVVFALAALISVGVHALVGPVEHSGSELHRVTSSVGTIISGSFLYVIAALNLVTLLGLLRLLRATRRGAFDDRDFERLLAGRGLLSRLLAGLTGAIRRPRQMYPIGLLFGLGFDTATEVALLMLAVNVAGAEIPWYAVLCLPILFAAGMSLMDTLDGACMNLAYGWALSQPLRKLYYNLTVTGLSIVIAALIGTIELGGLLSRELNLAGPFWTWLRNLNLSTAGFVIVGVLLSSWAVAAAVWRFGRLEQRWRPDTAGDGAAQG